MTDVLLRGLDPEVLARLKARARSQGRSLQAELLGIVEKAAQTSLLDARTVAARLRRQLAGRSHTDSARLLAEDRRR